MCMHVCMCASVCVNHQSLNKRSIKNIYNHIKTSHTQVVFYKSVPPKANLEKIYIGIVISFLRNNGIGHILWYSNCRLHFDSNNQNRPVMWTSLL